ncbi:hypothetical protein MPLA_650003 [Mesorhizobium sp. ORS 3359]|nr:hypothetical protein MPLA_650003 [Mesorhizobium sp. ORS 3359]
MRFASARLRCHCEISRAASKEISTTCLGLAGETAGGFGGSAKAALAEASEARLYARTRYERSIGNLLAGLFRPIGSRLSRKCGVDAIRQAPFGIWGSQPIFRPAPFHADKFSLKRGLKKRPFRGNNGF